MQTSTSFKAILVITLMWLCGCSERQESSTSSSDNQTENDFASPETAFQTAKTAILSDDYSGFCDCWTTDGRDLLAVGFVFIGRFYRWSAARKQEANPTADASESQENVRRINEVFERHGLPLENAPEVLLTGDEDADRKEVLKLIEPISDRTGFIIEMLELTPQVAHQPNFKLLQDDARLIDLAVTGDTASATLVQTREGKVLESPITFARVNGQWKITVIKRLLN